MQLEKLVTDSMGHGENVRTAQAVHYCESRLGGPHSLEEQGDALEDDCAALTKSCLSVNPARFLSRENAGISPLPSRKALIEVTFGKELKTGLEPPTAWPP